MDPSQSLSGAPRSYQTLYDAASAAQIPFNHANAASALLSEGGRFLAFAAKRNNRRVDATNSFAPAASLLVHFGEALRRAASPVRASAGGSASASATARLSVPNLAEIRARPRSLSPNARRNRSDDALAATSSDGFLDFEKALVPLITGSRDLNSLKEPAQAQGHRCLSTSDIPIVSVSLSSQDGSRPPPVRRNPYSVEEHKRAVLNLPSSSQWSNLNALRIYAGAPERSEEGIEKLYQYYAQLVNLNKKFDFASGKANINFFWYEAFASDKMVTSSCIHYEMACVLFNVAAVYSQLACSQRLFTKEGKKMASDYFKKAAGVFVHLRDTHCQRAQIRLERTSDLTDQFLTAAGQIMLAQSMECYFERANDDKASSKTMSMVAAQTADYYEMALRHAKEGLHILTKQRFPKYWVQQLTAKSFMYAAIAHYHAPLQLGPNQALGERVARLVVSKELATRAVKSSKEVGGSVHEVVKGYLDVITSSHLLADAANFDKHNSAPVDESLVTLLQRPKEALVIPVAMASSMGDLSRFSDMFAGFKPMDEELDLGVLSTFAVEVVERASRSLVQMKKEIDEEIKSHASLETESLREILAANKIRAEAIAEHIQVIQGDEAIESYVDMKQKLEIIHISIIQYLHETRTILETTPASSLADNQTKSLHATLCKAVHQTQRLQTRRHSILTSLRAEYSSNTLSDFHPTEWTFENLKTIIPALDPNRDLEIDDIVSEKKRGNAVFELKQALATLEKLKADCTCKLDEIKNFVESMDTIRDHNAIHTQRLRLKLIKEAETSIQLEKQIAVQKIFDVLGTVKQISPKRQVEEQSRKTIISFENSIKAYKKFRSGITLEISESTKLKGEAESIFKKAKDIKKSTGDNSVKSEQEIQNILQAQGPRVKELETKNSTSAAAKPTTTAATADSTSTAAPPSATPSAPKPGNQAEDEMLRNLRTFCTLRNVNMGGPGARGTSNGSVQPDAVLESLMQFQLDRVKATTAMNQPHPQPQQPAQVSDIHQFLFRIMDPNGSILPSGAPPAPTAAPAPAAPAAAPAAAPPKPKEDPPDVKTSKDINKFEDILHYTAVSTQQEINRLHRNKAAKEVELLNAAREESQRREEVSKLALKAHKVLDDVCYSGFGYNHPPPPVAAVYNHQTNQYESPSGTQQNYPYGPGARLQQQHQQQQPPGSATTTRDHPIRRPTIINNSEVSYDVYYTASQEPEAPTNSASAPLVRSPVNEEEELEKEQEILDRNIIENEVAAIRHARRLLKETEVHNRLAAEKEKLAQELLAKEQECQAMRNRITKMHYQQDNQGGGVGGGGSSSNGGGTAGGLTGAVSNLFGYTHMFDGLMCGNATVPPTMFNHDGIQQPKFHRAPAARFPGRQQQQQTQPQAPVHINMVQLPQTPVSEIFHDLELNRKAETPSLLQKLWNNAAAHHSEDSRSDSSHTRVSPTRKPVNLTKPGMEDKSIQETMDDCVADAGGTPVAAAVAASGHRKVNKKKSVMKHDSGISGMGSFSDIAAASTTKSRKHGDISKMVKFENEAAVSHFLGGGGGRGSSD